MICRGFNSHIMHLLNMQQVLWKCILSDGTEAWSDFDIPDQKDPWSRLRTFCNNNLLDIIEVKAIIPGNPETTVFKDDNGLDNILIIRGTSKDLNSEGETSYSFMTFGQLKDDGKIHVRRFYWPECEFGTYVEVREITPENEALLYRRKIACGDSCTCQSKEQS